MFSFSHDRPPNGEQAIGLCMLVHSLFESLDQLVALLDNFVFRLEDLLALAALQAFQIPYLFLDIMLLLDRFCLPGLPF
ncbi:hypothetical protein [Thiolapillus sp.]|uniref:hypothetical protein n=1 Tax=Thiolapillus sp. TaxID=2017437 RepID=UPI0025E59F3F|nr:hypothetical protein [Thiolapillus sp.]